MTIGTGDPMDIIETFMIIKTGVHFCNIKFAI